MIATRRNTTRRIRRRRRTLPWLGLGCWLLGLVPAAPAQPAPANLGPAARADSALVEVTPAVRQWRSPVSPTRAVLMSPVFPGWGQLHTDDSWRAALAFGAEMFYWSRVLMNDRRTVRLRDYANANLDPNNPDIRALYDQQIDEYHERVRDFAWWSFGAMLIIALDAYVGAHLFQFDRDEVPVPNDWDRDETTRPGSSAAQARQHAAAEAVAPPGPEGLVVFQWHTSF